MNKTFVSAISVLILIVIVAVVWTWDAEDGSPRLASVMGTPSDNVVASESGSLWAQSSSTHAPSSHMLNRLQVTQGRLHLSAQTLPLLDAFLAEHAGEPAETIGAQFKAALPTSLGKAALAEAEDLMTRYATYQNAMAEAEKENPISTHHDPSLTSVAKLYQAISLRDLHLGHDFHSALYGAAEAQQRYQLARQDILSTNGISDEQKNELLRKLDQDFAQHGNHLDPLH